MKAALWSALLVGSGGFAGSMLRYGVNVLVREAFPLARFPHGTLIVNLLGCLLIGGFAGFAEARPFAPDARLFAVVGVLGGFTTFSAFGYESFALLRDGELGSATANVALHVVFGLGCVWLGYGLAAPR